MGTLLYPLGTLTLKKNQEKRLLNGHVWIYSNEIDTGLAAGVNVIKL